MTGSNLYRPDDAQMTVASLAFLRTEEGVRLRRRIGELPGGGGEPTVAQVAALRKEFPAGPTHAGLTLAKLQPRAAGTKGKFPQLNYVWASPEALEQATHLVVGRHKAGRMAQFGARRVFDLCAGIGGDALAFAEKIAVMAVELSPVRAACLRFNAMDCVPPPAHPVEVREEDVEKVIQTLPADAWVHIDPARRTGGKRSVRYEDLIPGPQLLERLLTRARTGAGGCVIKLSSAVDFESLPAGHVELISHQGSVVQALLWTGTGLAENERTASVLGRGESWSLTARPREVLVQVPAGVSAGGFMLYELDGAVTRAGLAQVVADALGLMPLTMDGGYLLTPTPIVPSAEGNWMGNVALALTAFEVRTIVPFARVTEALAALPAAAPGPVEVKARGNLPGLDTDVLQRQWTKSHGRACTVLLFRQEKETLAAVGFRASAE